MQFYYYINKIEEKILEINSVGLVAATRTMAPYCQFLGGKNYFFKSVIPNLPKETLPIPFMLGMENRQNQ